MTDPTLDAVTAAAAAYATAAAASATAAMQVTLDQAQADTAAARADLATAQSALAAALADDTSDNAKISALASQVSSLQAQLAAAASSSSYTQPTGGVPMPTTAGTSPSLKAGTSTSAILLPSGDLSGYWKDFAEADGLAGIWWRAKKVFGAGVDRTILGITPDTVAAAKVAKIKAIAKGQPNLFYLARIDGDTELAGLTLRGGSQGGVNYNGLNVYKGNKGHVHDIAIELIPGSGSEPPNETFPVNDQRCVDELYERIVLRLAGSASGFGSNMSTRTTVKDFDFSGSTAAAGAAVYKGTDIQFLGGRAVRNAKVGINWEQMAGTNVVDHVEFAGNGVDMAFNANQDYKAGALFEIHEPIKPLGQPLTLRIGKTGYTDYQNPKADKTQAVTWDMIWLTVDGVRKNVKDWGDSVVKLIVA